MKPTPKLARMLMLEVADVADTMHRWQADPTANAQGAALKDALVSGEMDADAEAGLRSALDLIGDAHGLQSVAPATKAAARRVLARLRAT